MIGTVEGHPSRIAGEGKRRVSLSLCIDVLVQQAPRRYTERLSDLVNSAQARIATASPFDGRQVSPVKIGPVGKVLLGHFLRAPDAADVLTETLADVGFHTALWATAAPNMPHSR